MTASAAGAYMALYGSIEMVIIEMEFRI